MATSRAAWAGVAATALAGAATAGPADVALSGPWHARRPWRLLVTWGPGVEDGGGNAAPGEIGLCLSANGGRSCGPDLGQALRVGGTSDDYDRPHYLEAVRVVGGGDVPRLLMIRLASLFSGNGDQRRALLLLDYRRPTDDFRLVFRQVFGRNNNQDARWLARGPLRGMVATVEPTRDAPFGYWVDLHARQGSGYRRRLRYRSATRYGDGNPLAVIDAEMPEIERRLGVWWPGRPLPLPDQPCGQPHLVRGALWCGRAVSP